MAYTPTTWVDGVSVADAAKMNNIEGGIVGAYSVLGYNTADQNVAHGTSYEAEETLTGYVLPTNLKAGDLLVFRATYAITTSAGTTGFVRIKLGSTVLWSVTCTTSDLGTITAEVECSILVRATNDQASATYWRRGFSGQTYGGIENQSRGAGVATEDLTSAKTLALIMMISGTTAASPTVSVKQSILTKQAS